MALLDSEQRLDTIHGCFERGWVYPVGSLSRNATPEAESEEDYVARVYESVLLPDAKKQERYWWLKQLVLI